MKDVSERTWKLIAAGGALALLVAGFALGRWATPPRTVVTESIKTVEVEKQVVVAQTRTVIRVVRVNEHVDATKDVKETETTTRPDGTVTTKTREESGTTKTDRDTSTDTKTAETSRTEDRTKMTEIDRTKTTSSGRSTWSAAADVGVFVPSVFDAGKGASLVPGVPRWMDLGLSVDHRLLGPVFVGVRVGSIGTLGVRLKVDF